MNNDNRSDGGRGGRAVLPPTGMPAGDSFLNRGYRNNWIACTARSSANPCRSADEDHRQRCRRRRQEGKGTSQPPARRVIRGFGNPLASAIGIWRLFTSSVGNRECWRAARLAPTSGRRHSWLRRLSSRQAASRRAALPRSIGPSPVCCRCRKRRQIASRRRSTHRSRGGSIPPSLTSSNRAAKTSRIRPSRFVHVVYRTRQFDKMIQWVPATSSTVASSTRIPSWRSDLRRRASPRCLGQLVGGRTAGRRGRATRRHRCRPRRLHVWLRRGAGRELRLRLKEKGILPLLVHPSRRDDVDVLRRSGRQPDGDAGRCLASSDAANDYMNGPAFRDQPDRRRVRSGEVLAKIRTGTPGSAFLARPSDLPVADSRRSIVP